MNNLYYEGQQLPEPDEIDYMTGAAVPLQCKADGKEAGTAFDFDHKALQRALKHIYEKDFHPITEIEENLFNETFRIIDEAARTGLSQSGADIPVAFRQKLEQGNAVFSAFKVHRMQNDIATQLYDSNGVLKPFEQWKNDVHPMLDHHVGHWLRTEYDTAVLRAGQAADWQRFEQYADILPNLEWMPSTSVHPGADHKAFWGTILPLNHPFWNVHRPGDRWNCKCSLSATDAPPTGAPRSSNEPKDRPAPGLDNNPGMDGRLFSDTHPYIANAYEGAREAVKEYMVQRTKKGKTIEPEKGNEALKTRRKEIRKKIEHLKDEVFTNKAFGKEITFSKKGIKEWLSQPHKHLAAKNEMLIDIKNVIRTSKYLGYGSDEHNASITMHLFETEIEGDKTWIVVREMFDGEVRLHSISDNEKILKYLTKKAE